MGTILIHPLLQIAVTNQAATLSPFEILLPYLPSAIEHAKKLQERNRNKPPASAAPGTRVYELLEKLRPYLVAP